MLVIIPSDSWKILLLKSCPSHNVVGNIEPEISTTATFSMQNARKTKFTTAPPSKTEQNLQCIKLYWHKSLFVHSKAHKTTIGAYLEPRVALAHAFLKELYVEFTHH